MNWKSRYEFRKITDINKVKPGMMAKLIVGNEVKWCNDAWILNNKGKIFEVNQILKPDDQIELKIPYKELDPRHFRNNQILLCNADLDWLEFSGD